MLAYNLHVYGKWLETSIIKTDDDVVVVVVEYYRDPNDNTHTDFENKYHLVYNYHELDIVVQGESILEKIINIAFFIL
jgi:hypothetical protein